jgi:lipid-binding SYLF domain-containing protein
MTRATKALGTGLLLLALPAAPLRAGPKEVKTVEAAAQAVRELGTIPLRGVPQGLLNEAAGVAILPHVVRAGLLIDHEFGRGVILVRQPDGRWSDPIFVTLSGGGIGGQAGVASTDLVLVFKTRRSLDRALHGRLALGTDVAVAAGLIGREVASASDRRLKAEIWTYSRSRGLFVGVSLEGTRLQVDPRSNEAFYGIRGCRPEHVLARQGAAIAAAEGLKTQLAWLAGAPAPPSVVVVPYPVPAQAPTPPPPVGWIPDPRPAQSPPPPPPPSPPFPW